MKEELKINNKKIFKNNNNEALIIFPKNILNFGFLKHCNNFKISQKMKYKILKIKMQINIMKNIKISQDKNK